MSTSPSPVAIRNATAHGAARADVMTYGVPEAVTAGMDERWAAWKARGVAQDRAMRRQMWIAAPILALVAIALFVLLIG